MKDQLLDILNDLNPSVDYETCTNLISGGHINSLAMLTLVSSLEEEFDIEIPTVEIVAENFESVDAMAALIERLLEEELD